MATLAATVGCSGDEGARADVAPRETTSTVEKGEEAEAGSETSTPSLDAVLVPPNTRRARHRYASLAELRWAARWSAWVARADRSASRLAVVFDGREANPVPPTGALRFLGRCAADLARIGRVPTTRLGDAARATAEACERFEVAIAALEEAVEQGEPPSQTSLPDLEEAVREFDGFVRGMDRESPPLPFVDRPRRRTRIQIRYTHAASRLVEEQVTVYCYGAADWRREVRARGRNVGRASGFVESHGASAHLAPIGCRWLDRLAYSRRPPSSPEAKWYIAQAVSTLAHEAKHTLGTRSERVAECYGMQQIRPLARALGAPRAYAAELADLYWEHIYPLAPPAYSSEACRPGGRLDIRPRSSIWP
ncbi:MAG: hypothetical protein ACRDNI_00060 [Gaiellaceae bacterium]